jgi:AcrR family transcriptional regulator
MEQQRVARTLDPEVHALRREGFVDAAQRLIGAKGYEQMSIQDVLAELDTSKGAFYHYFDSKAALLEAVIERMTDAAIATVAPVIDDPTLTPFQKLEGLFGGISRWKLARSDLLLAVLAVWQADENAIVREKLRKGIDRRLAPLLASVVRAGQADGTFTTSSADDVAHVVVSLLLSANEAATDLYFARQANTISFEDVERRLAAFEDALERVLEIPPGSFPIVDRAVLRDWFG